MRCGLKQLYQRIFVAIVGAIPWLTIEGTVVSNIEVDQAYLHRSWQFEEGLPQNTVQAVLQTKDGYLWVGIQKGLARFDGVQFTVFDSNNVPEIKHPSIFCLQETHDGSLWIGTDGGLTRLKDGQFRHYSKSEGLPHDGIRALCERKDGTLWVSTLGGLSCFDGNRFSPLADKSLASLPLIRSFFEADEGVLWMANPNGAVRHTGKDTTTFNLPPWMDNYQSPGRVIYRDSKGAVWLGRMEGLVRLNDDAEPSVYYRADGLADNIVNAMHEDSAGNLWIGTYGGLNRFKDGKFYTEFTSEGTPYDLVHSICEDREGNIWVGTKDGLSRLRPRRVLVYTTQQGMNHNNVISVLEDKSGVMWAGTWGGGINRIEGEAISHGLIRAETYGLRKKTKGNGMWSDFVLAMHETRDGAFWFGLDYDGGLFRWSTNTLARHGEPHGLTDVAVRVLHQDREGYLWAAARNTLFRLKDEVFTPFGKKEGVPGPVRAICESRTGDLWVGTTNGLALKRNDQFTTFDTRHGLSHNFIQALYEDAEGALWIGTSGGGLNRYKDGKFSAYTMEDGLFQSDLFEILEDDFGNLWMSCRFGIFRVSKKELADFDAGKVKRLSSVSYGKHDGLVTIQCNNTAKPGSWKSRDGRLWFATSRGLAVIDPGMNLKRNETPPAVYIETIIADQKKVTDDIWNTATPRDKASAPIHLAPGRGELEIHYTALSFSEPSKNRFRYKLDGVDRDWVDAGARHEAYYSQLSPGRYRFRVQACNNDGVWNEMGAHCDVYLAPHFYETAWFYLGCLSIAGLGIFGVYRVRIQRLNHRQRELSNLVEERTRALQTAHQQLVETSRKAGMAEVASGVLHNVGNVLNSVNVSATLITDSARDMRVPSLRKAISLMRENAEGLEDFLKKDDKGKQLPVYLEKVSEHLADAQTSLMHESQALARNVDHIRDIIAMQQSYAKVSGVVETVQVSDLMEDALRMNGATLARPDIALVKDYQSTPAISVEKHKVLQIIVNLVTNAVHACDEQGHAEKRVKLSTLSSQTHIQIVVSDNGVGIPTENLTRIFSHGFTTRKKGHGFGLHSGALTAKELGGSLTAHSDGPGKGATFRLELPLAPRRAAGNA